LVPIVPARRSLAVEGTQSTALKEPDRRWFICLVLVCLGGFSFTLDVPISRIMVGQDWPQPWQGWRETIDRSLAAFEPFGQPAAVISVSLAVLLCGGPRRGLAFRIAAGALGAGLCADVLKTLVARVRPREFNFQGTVTDTFHSFFPGAAGGSQIQSWPSAHTATAVGFCLALSTVFPRGRWLFVSLAVLVAVQRIEAGAHYLSDTVFATAVAYGVWILVFGRMRRSVVQSH
jgi:membrane-associated phospholipid phosphatase